MRTFKLPEGWPPVFVRLSCQQTEITIDGQRILLHSAGDPRTLRGVIPGVLGWAEIVNNSLFGQCVTTPSRCPMLYVRVEQIAREFDYHRRIAILEVPLTGVGGNVGHFKESNA
jgi:hypothetical protein